MLPAESSTRNHVAASSLSPQVARKGSTLSGFVQRSRLEREVGRDLHFAPNSPHLFILLVDYILRQSLGDEDGFTVKPANGRKHPVFAFTALACADDVAINSDSARGAERILRRLQTHSEAIDLKLNAAKTKVLHVGYESDPEPILSLDGTAIDACDIYNYLGLTTLSSNVVIRQIRRRLVNYL